jgi:small-conductance mechanosensitive channel
VYPPITIGIQEHSISSSKSTPSLVSEFLECFSRHRRTKWGVEAWKEMNVSEQQLTRKELQRWLYGYLHSLIFLKQALSSYPELLSNLDLSSNVFVAFAMFLVFLLIFGVEFTDSMATYASTVAILAVFGRNVFTQFFDAIYLIFVLCPFEVGDTVLIDGERFRVNAIHIMSTEMITALSAGNTVVTKSNSSLMGKDIHNLSRTQNPYHHITFYVSQNTTTRQLNELKTRIDSFIRNKMKSDIRDTWFVLQGVDRECRMNISLFLGSVYSFSDNNAMWRQIHIINKQIREEVTKMGVQFKRFSANEVTLQFDAAGQQQALHGASPNQEERRSLDEEERRPHRAQANGTASRSRSSLASSYRTPSHGMLVHGGRSSGNSTAIGAIIDASLSVSNAHHVHI